jgi:hypothetical protein
MAKDRDERLFSSEDVLTPPAEVPQPEPQSEDVAGTPGEGPDPLAAGDEDTVTVRYVGEGQDAKVSVGGYDIDFAGGDQEVPRSVAQAAAETFDTVEVAE